MVNQSSILVATGATIRPELLEKETCFYVTDFGASPDASPVTNTTAINETIKKASSIMGATVVIPSGTFYVYTIRLKSNVNLYLEDGAIIAAAKTGVPSKSGAYQEPEVNKYLGIQDHGHSYFANSLIYGADLENIMICGNGLFTGGRFDDKTGLMEYVLMSSDPCEPDNRSQNGHNGEWYGNKCIALVRCKNVVLIDFSITIGGHFAIIAEGCQNMYVNNVLIDTTRDAFDIDCCQDVTVTNTTCNSLTDDAICIKASYGAGLFMPTKNILIEDCIVSGYDAGSVYAKEYTRDKLTADDMCSPTGRVKLGTESTCGYHQVTIRRVKFDRSRGFALEAVDCSSLTDVIFTDCTMDNVSSSPIFIRVGDRGRFPVTGNTVSENYPSLNDVRIDNCNWVLPDKEGYKRYPVKRYAPHYNRTKHVTIDGYSYIPVIDEQNPVSINMNNFETADGKYYLKVGGQKTDKEISKKDLPLYANAIGCVDFARIENIYIGNIKATNVDPRYPILIMGLTDSHIKNVTLESIEVEYRGGLDMSHAVEQRQLNTQWQYSQFHAPQKVQTIPWLANSFFTLYEGLLPRVDWDVDKLTWVDDAYNVPELPNVYPEPSNWGILPAYGIYARHVDELKLDNIKISCLVPDKRHVGVFDDCNEVLLDNMTAAYYGDTVPIAVIKNKYRRHTNAENVPEQPYFTTSVTNFENNSMLKAREIEINCPAPGTPRDSLYDFPTVACSKNGYSYAIATDDYPLPLTVHRPFVEPISPITVKAGETANFKLIIRNPASDISDIKNDRIAHCVCSMKVDLSVSASNIPEGASFDSDSLTFNWKPCVSQRGNYEVGVIIDDGVLKEKALIKISVV